MSLDWNISNIKNWEELRVTGTFGPMGEFVQGKGEHSRLSPITETFVFLTMIVGIGQITEKNHAEFYKRVHLLEAVHGAYLKELRDGNLVERPITMEDVRRHIGLRTNVSYVSPAKWLKGVWDNWKVAA